MARYETFNAFMTALVAYAPLVGIIAYFASEQTKVLFSGLVTFFFWLSVVSYFVWDYRKMHKKPKPKTKFPPLSTETVEPSKLVTKVRSKRVIVINAFFVALEAFEAVFFISIIGTWQTFTISNITVLTYENAILIGSFIFGLFLVVDLVRRFRSKKAFFGDE